MAQMTSTGAPVGVSPSTVTAWMRAAWLRENAPPSRQRPQAARLPSASSAPISKPSGSAQNVSGISATVCNTSAEQHRHGAVQEAPVFIGQQACNQREGHHGQQQVEGPLAQILAKTAGIGQPGQHGLAPRLARGPHRP